MAINAINNVQMKEYKPSRKGLVAGSVAGMGTGGVYVAASMKNTIASQKANAAKAAIEKGADLAKQLKQVPKNIALASATVILGATALGATIGAIVDKVKNNKAQEQATKQA